MQTSSAIVIHCFLSLCKWGLCDKTWDEATSVTAGTLRLYTTRCHHPVQMSVSRWICCSFTRRCQCALWQDLLHNTGSTKESRCSAVEKSARSHPKLIRYWLFVTVLASHHDAEGTVGIRELIHNFHAV